MMAADAYIETTSKAYNNVSLLEESNKNADKNIKPKIDNYRSVLGGTQMDAPLTKKAFYETINEPGGSVEANGKVFTAKDLTNALANGSTEYSYEDYLNTYTSSDEYQKNYGADVRSNKRNEFEQALGGLLIRWQKESPFSGKASI
jgi:hypothetical protein